MEEMMIQTVSENQHLDIVLSGNDKTHICVKKGVEASFYVLAQNDVDATLTMDIEDDAKVTMLCWNESSAMKLNSVINVGRNAVVRATYGEMSDGDVESKIVYALKGEGSDVEIKSASVVKNKKVFDIQCIHEAPHTTGIMENYAVVHENGNYEMVDTGKIVEGAYGSQSHQTTRVLTLNNNQQSHVTPLLLIDENDVQASHATTMGQPDENQLYYLETRGLTRMQALGLITIGYLMPVARGLNNPVLEEELSKKIEAKAGLECLM